MNNSIFREYDIRGIADSDLSDEVVGNIGFSFASMLIENGLSTISIGRDCRKSSERIFKVLSEALLKSGINVVDLGMITTPVLYFSLYGLKVDGGIMITASHNPSDYNGFKAAIGKNVLSSEQIQDLKERILVGKYVSLEVRGSLNEFDIIQDYKEDILKSINIKRRIRVGVDCANTPIGLFAKDILVSAGCEVYELFPEPDGDFPNHHPDPSVKENLVDLINLVRKESLDLGISFDGDADRIGIVDEKGDFIYSDMVLLLLARAVLAERPGSKIIGEVKCSKNLFDDIHNNGGLPIMWKTGHSNIKRKIKEESAPLAGELSGHIFFADKHHGFDDALYAALRFIEVVSSQSKALSSMLSNVPKMYSTPEIRIDFPEKEKFQFIEEFKELMRKDIDKEAKVITVDGIRVETANGWALVRASNTQPALTIRFEADSELNLNTLKKEIEKKLREVSSQICLF
ncbi:phosphomannomutase/phosphoglucomutase [bacterium]|nr:phosphomannomutase/phosphoglucomutase [bacterium]MBT3849806.1 phosphomannomutase/phosphoglucomutase [bacterium]MBT4634403.1 phosphomannomutase/phosphoglucomutase [bacterium]